MYQQKSAVYYCTTNKSSGGRATAGEQESNTPYIPPVAVYHTWYVQRRAERNINTHSNQVRCSINSIYKVVLLCVTVYNQQKRRRASDGGRAMYVHTANTVAV